MGKHETGYARIERDNYPTPAWVITALAGVIELAGKWVWECACGDGRMAEALKQAGAQVFATDIEDRGYSAFDDVFDFVSDRSLTRNFDGLITNPPFGPRGKLAEHFIEQGLERMWTGFLALLLPADFDSAKTRMHLFDHCPQFAGKLVLTRRIKWFEHPTMPDRQPKENSAWYLWGSVELQSARRVPVIRYAPQPTGTNIHD